VGEKSEVGAQCPFMASFKVGRGEIVGETAGRCGCKRSRVEEGGGWTKGKGLTSGPRQSVTRGRRGGAGPMRDRWVLMVKFRQPSHEFTFGVGMTFVSYPLVLTPMV
jgi:hypothetical protein